MSGFDLGGIPLLVYQEKTAVKKRLWETPHPSFNKGRLASSPCMKCRGLRKSSLMSVDVSLYDGNGHVTSDNTYAQKQWFSPFVDAAYGNAVFQAPGSFDVFATQDALIARPG